MSKKPYFMPYQARWINEPARAALGEKARRVGLTYGESFRATKDSAAGKVKHDKTWFSSADISAGEEFIDYVKFWARFLDIVAKDVGEVVINKENDIRARRVVFANGAEINALSSNPSQFRSKGGDVILDEFAHHKSQERVFAAAKPTFMWGNRLRVISTHNGEESYFNSLIAEMKKGKAGTMARWAHHKTTIDDAIKDGLIDRILGHKPTDKEVAEFLEDCFSGMTQEAIQEEFYCVPRSGANSHLLTYELINAIERTDILYELLEQIIGDMYVGMDVGRSGHPSVIWILEKLGELLYTRKVIPLKNVQYRDQKNILYDILRHPKFRRACIDSTGIGDNLAEDAMLDFGKLRVEPVKFTNSSKESLASGAFINVEGKRVLIPRDKAIRDSFYKIRAVTTAAGNTRYVADDSDGEHGDYFWGFALACEAAKTYSGPVIIGSTGRRESLTMLKNYLG